MTTRGMVRSTIPPTSGAPIVLRASGGPSILRELSNEQVAVAMDDAVRLNAAAVAVQVFIGGEFETQSVRNMTTLVDEGQRVGMPVLAVTAVGRELTRDARYLRLAVRICAELGAQVVKTYYCAEDFDTVTAGCPVPVVMAGGKKLPELDALAMAYQRHRGRGGRRRHGPQHLPERPSGRDDPRHSRGGARVGQAGARLRGVRAAGRAGQLNAPLLPTKEARP